MRRHHPQQPITEESPRRNGCHYLRVLSEPAAHLEIARLDHLAQRLAVDQMFTDQLIHLSGQLRH